MFEEVQALYSDDMIDVFTGGLIYEFTQEPNNYGLVEILPDGNVKLLQDYHTLKTQLNMPDLNYQQIAQSMKYNAQQIQQLLKTQDYALPRCKLTYENIAISQGLPKSLAVELIREGVSVQRGKLAPLLETELESTLKVLDVNGEIYMETPTVALYEDIASGSSSTKKHAFGGHHNCTYNDVEDDSSDYDSSDSEDDSPKKTEKNVIFELFRKVSTAFSNLCKAATN